MTTIAASLVATSLGAAVPLVAAADDDAASVATSGAGPVEIVDKRTETTEVFQNPDGTTTLKEYGAPVHVRQGGEWVDVDYDLVKNADGSYSPKAAPTDVTVGGGGTSTAARIDLEDDKSVAVTWPGTLPAPSIDGGVATYKLSTSTDLIVAVTGGGVATRIRLNSEPTAEDPSWKLGLRTENLDVDQASASTLTVSEDATGKKIADTSPMLAWDAERDRAGDPVNTAPVTADLSSPVTTGDIDKQTLALSAPEAFLNDPDTQYPVVIDPDFKVSGIKDTWVRSGTPNTQTANTGFNYRLLVGALDQASSGNHQAMSYLQWDNAQLAALKTPKYIVSAEMGLYQYDAASCSPRAINGHPIIESWSESMSFDYRPEVNTGTGDSVATSVNPGGAGCSTANAFVKFNMTEMVKAWAAGTYTNYGVRLNVPAANVSDTTYLRRFCSSEPDTSTTCASAAAIPYLSVTWNTPPSAPSAVTAAPCVDCQLAPLVLNSATPSLRAKVADPDADTVRADFEVFAGHSAAPTNRVAYGSSTAKSGALASWTVPALPDNDYSYRVRAWDGRVFSAWSSWKQVRVRKEVPDRARGVYNSLEATKVYDTTAGDAAPAAGAVVEINPLRGTNIEAAGVTSVAIDVTATSATAAQTAITAWPAGQNRPPQSGLTFGSSAVPRSNMLLVKVGAGGKINILNSAGSAGIRVVLLGYFETPDADNPDGWFSSIEPTRIFDTEVAGTAENDGVVDNRAGAVTPAAVRTVNVDKTGPVPTGTRSVYANITVVSKTGAQGTLLSSSNATPNSSNATAIPFSSEKSSRGLFLNLDADGNVYLKTDVEANVSIDLAGYFSPLTTGSVYTPLTQAPIGSTNGSNTVPAGQELTFSASNVSGLPAPTTHSLALTVVTSAASNGSLLIYPKEDYDEDTPTNGEIPTLYYDSGMPLSQTVIVELAVDRSFTVRNFGTGPATVNVGVQGWFGVNEDFREVEEVPAEEEVEDPAELEVPFDSEFEILTDDVDAAGRAAPKTMPMGDPIGAKGLDCVLGEKVLLDSYKRPNVHSKMKGKKAYYRCGYQKSGPTDKKSNFGYEHTFDSHKTHFEGWCDKIKGCDDWEALADGMMRYVLRNPDRVIIAPQKNEKAPRRYCYSRHVKVRRKSDGTIYTRQPKVILGETGRTIITAMPNRKGCQTDRTNLLDD